MTSTTLLSTSNHSLNAYRRLYDQTDPCLPIEELRHPLFDEKQLRVSVVRVDQIHPQISGNKWFKLKYNLKAVVEQGAKRVISFGGAYSNHLHALAYACHRLGLASTGVVRGEPVDNPMLTDAKAWGMQIHFVDRASYRLRSVPEWISELQETLGAGAVLPEGGSNALAVKGVGELMRQINRQEPALDYLLCACGTGGTLAGLVSHASGVIVQGVPVLKKGAFIRDEVQSLLDESPSSEEGGDWQLDLEGHYGGYGKIKPDHVLAMRALEDQFSLPLDPVYTAKLFRRFMEKVQTGEYPLGSKIALLHTGGLQGSRSIA